MSQQNRVTGLTSAFESPSDNPPPSAVSSLASQFETPTSTSTTPHLSNKLSGIANRFSTTVADMAAAKAPRSRNQTPIKASTADAAKEQLVNPVVEERPDFSAITKRFALGEAGEIERKGEGEGKQNMFASARTAFAKIEEEGKARMEGRVSAVARGFEKGEMGRKEVERKHVVQEGGKVGVEEKVVAEKANSVGNIAGRFEGVVHVRERNGGGEEKELSLADKFENAARVFGKVGVEGKKGGEGVDSRIADASKVFRGSN